MEKICKATVEVRLAGNKAEAYLTRKNRLRFTSRADDGTFLVSRFSGRESMSVLGTISVGFGYVEKTGNREVILFGGELGKDETGRRVNVNEAGEGRQQFTKGVDIIVQTDAARTVFEANTR